MAPNETRTRWAGGPIRWDKKGRPTFIIERMVNGKRYLVSTRCHDRRAAEDHLRRFEANPSLYDPRGAAGKLALDRELAKEYLAYSKREKKNSRGWLLKQRAFLKWWEAQLRGKDIRAPALSLRDHILPPLKGASSRHHRISVLKGLFTWLRKIEHRITTAEDPVFGQLSVPQAAPAQLTKSKVVPRDHFELVRGHLVGPFRDALTVQGGTGWHTTEVCRFAEAGSVEPVPPGADALSAAVLVCPLRKSGEPQRTRVLEEAAEAGRRLVKHGGLSREWYDRAVVAACRAAGIPKFTPGRLRHSVATWAIEAGADPAQVAAFLGHESPRTTRRFYATHAAPARVPALV